MTVIDKRKISKYAKGEELYLKIKAEIDKGLNAKEAASNLNLPYESVNRLVKLEKWNELDIYPKKNKNAIVLNENIDLIKKLVADEEKSSEEIAKYFNVPLSSYNYWLKSKGIGKQALIRSKVWEQRKYIRKELEGKITINQIAKSLDVSAPFLKVFLEENRKYFGDKKFTRQIKVEKVREVEPENETSERESSTSPKNYSESDFDFLLPTNPNLRKGKEITNNPKINQKVRKLLLLGYNPTFIGRKLDITIRTVQDFAKAHNFHLLPHYSLLRTKRKTPPKTTNENVPQIKTLLEEGKSIRFIYRQLKPEVSFPTFISRIKKLGLVPEKITEVKRLEPYKKEIEEKLKTGQNFSSIAKDFNTRYRVIKKIANSLGYENVRK